MKQSGLVPVSKSFSTLCRIAQGVDQGIDQGLAQA